MNFTESFQDFSAKVGPTDLALYAGVGLVVWVLFKDKLSPVQTLISTVVNKAKGLLNKKTGTVVVKPVLEPVVNNSEDLFFKLVVSWKQTRDLAAQSGCEQAVKAADQMFPYLSPNVCNKQVKE